MILINYRCILFCLALISRLYNIAIISFRSKYLVQVLRLVEWVPTEVCWGVPSCVTYLNLKRSVPQAGHPWRETYLSVSKLLVSLGYQGNHGNYVSEIHQLLVEQGHKTWELRRCIYLGIVGCMALMRKQEEIPCINKSIVSLFANLGLGQTGRNYLSVDIQMILPFTSPSNGFSDYSLTQSQGKLFLIIFLKENPDFESYLF